MKIIPLPAEFAPVSIPVPPMLEAALEYRGSADWIGICWETAGDARLIDGLSNCPGNWNAYLNYVRHDKVRFALSHLQLGNDETLPIHLLVLDRNLRLAYAAPYQIGCRWLLSQHSPPIMQSHRRTLKEILASPPGLRHMPTFEEAMEGLAARRKQEYDLSNWLHFSRPAVCAQGHGYYWSEADRNRSCPQCVCERREAAMRTF